MKRYRLDIDDIDSITADPTTMKRYRVDIDDIDSNTVDTTGTISIAIQLIQLS